MGLTPDSNVIAELGPLARWHEAAANINAYIAVWSHGQRLLCEKSAILLLHVGTIFHQRECSRSWSLCSTSSVLPWAMKITFWIVSFSLMLGLSLFVSASYEAR
jgi:hypothetical protein